MKPVPKAPSSDAPWALAPAVVLARVDSTEVGLTSEEAARRLRQRGPNALRPTPQTHDLSLLWRQFSSPIILILVVATAIAIAAGDAADGLIIAAIVVLSGLLGFVQERAASRAVEALLAMVSANATVLRDGVPVDIPIENVVLGDIVVVDTGDVVPGDCLLIAAAELLVDEAALTGESFPIEKSPAELPVETPVRARSNVLHLGTHVVSGRGTALVVRTGRDTEFGRVSAALERAPARTAFERGVTRFGEMLTGVMIALVAVVFVINLSLERPLLESLLFSIALAVGITPQLLPAIVGVSLSAGARHMAARRVVVRRLISIEDLGGLSVLCTDKTGTLTEGAVRLEGALDISGQSSGRVLSVARINASLQRSFSNPIDDAIVAGMDDAPLGERWLDELPYDFHRRLLTVLVEVEARRWLITKGAVASVLDVCTEAEHPDGRIVPLADVRREVEARFRALSAEGLRVLAVARRETSVEGVTVEDERALTFLGFLTFADPPKRDSAATVRMLAEIGVSVRMVTGDNRFVAAHVGTAAGLDSSTLLVGEEVERLDDVALAVAVGRAQIFAEVTPVQKERIVRAFTRTGAAVGYLGDGINDVPALRAADVGISVNEAVPVAKEAADVILLDKELDVLTEGIRLGRRTFANTLKYVSVTTSANFGNTISMAAAATWLPFLPLLPRQVLLLNFLSDLPAMAIAGDAVDPEQLAHPQRWDTRAAARFMMTFGLISTVFDGLTFVVLRVTFDAAESLFHSGWFIESVATELCVMLVLRTRRMFVHSRPGMWLALISVVVAVLTVALPFTPAASALGFVAPPVRLLLTLAALTAGYVAATEIGKWAFFHRGIGRKAATDPRRIGS